MKDIFIDTNIAVKLAKPPDDCYKNFVKWLFANDEEDKSNNAVIVISDELLKEYRKSNLDSYKSATSIAILISTTSKQGRQNKKSRMDIDRFKRKFYTSSFLKTIRCNEEDKDHIPLVFLSVRKMALSEDENFLDALSRTPRHTGILGRCPNDFNYT